MIKNKTNFAKQMKWKTKKHNLFIAWQSDDETKKQNNQIKHLIKRAEYMIKFWQEELEYLKVHSHIQTYTKICKQRKNKN